jgi:hypothetical protein
MRRDCGAGIAIELEYRKRAPANLIGQETHAMVTSAIYKRQLAKREATKEANQGIFCCAQMTMGKGDHTHESLTRSSNQKLKKFILSWKVVDSLKI